MSASFDQRAARIYELLREGKEVPGWHLTEDGKSVIVDQGMALGIPRKELFLEEKME